MNTPHVLFHVALADFFERARRYRFLLILGAIIYLGVLVNNGTLFIAMNPADSMDPLAPGYRGEFNSAWIGTMTVLVLNCVLGLIGFYLVSDCIERDTRTGVGQIIATTPIRRVTYLVGKWISNFGVLALLVLILAAAAVVMVLLKREATLDFVALLMPFLAVALPYMALVAALAVVFETVPWLRGAAGNVVYFFVWLFSLALALALGTNLPVLKDPLGYNVFQVSISASAQAAFPSDSLGAMAVGNSGYGFKVFNWPGLEWTPGIIGAQWIWAAFGFGLILLSALWFARFDPSRESLRRSRGKPEEAKDGEHGTSPKKSLHTALANIITPISRLSRFLDISPLVSKIAQLNPFLGVLFAELRMLLKGRRWWWWLVTAGLNVAILISPVSITKEYLLPIALLWLMPILSVMGNRERKNRTHQMVFSAARPVLRQLPTVWLAGVVSTTLLVISGGIVFLINGDLPALAGWAGAVVFIPTLALALGVFSSGSRFFEVVFVVWTYLGPMQKMPGLDYLSSSPQVYLLAAAGLLLLSAYWRGRQVRV